jgi:hypothetical protein
MLTGQAPAEALFQEAAHVGAAEVVVSTTQPPGEQYRRHLVRSGILQALKDMTTA